MLLTTLFYGAPRLVLINSTETGPRGGGVEHRVATGRCGPGGGRGWALPGLPLPTPLAGRGLLPVPLGSLGSRAEATEGGTGSLSARFPP